MAKRAPLFAGYGSSLWSSQTRQTIDGKAGGIAVSLGARVAALAEPGQVLATSTVKDVVVGSGLTLLLARSTGGVHRAPDRVLPEQPPVGCPHGGKHCVPTGTATTEAVDIHAAPTGVAQGGVVVRASRSTRSPPGSPPTRSVNRRAGTVSWPSVRSCRGPTARCRSRGWSPSA